MEKWVKVMSDYCSDGLWEKDGCMFCREDLPISRSLLDRLESWCTWFEECEEDCTDPEDRKGPPFDYVSFSREGLEIARAIKAELPDWTVIYHDRAKILDDEDQPRSGFEYEIHGIKPTDTAAPAPQR